MSLLGQYYKQPVEVEYYGIQFVEDMSSTDEIQTSFTIIAREFAEPWDLEVIETIYTPVLADNDRIIVTTDDVLVPTGPEFTDGFRLNVSNYSQTGSITVGTINVPARGATVVVLKNGVFVEEAKTNSVVVNATGDQRVRTRVFKGTPFEVYKVQVTVSTTEGRTMQDEFTVEIEED